MAIFKSIAVFIFAYTIMMTKVTAQDFVLQPGDVILISFDCYECRVIEDETNSPFSHSGVVVQDENGELKIAQSLGVVKLYDLESFLKNRRAMTKGFVYRAFELDKMVNDESLKNQMTTVFYEKYNGHLFDEKYLWDNVDKNGEELFYCSEFIAKFLDHFLLHKTIPRVLTYDKNEDYWRRHFRGQIPVNVVGNSPASFSRDERFHLVGILD